VHRVAGLSAHRKKGESCTVIGVRSPPPSEKREREKGGSGAKVDGARRQRRAVGRQEGKEIDMGLQADLLLNARRRKEGRKARMATRMETRPESSTRGDSSCRWGERKKNARKEGAVVAAFRFQQQKERGGRGEKWACFCCMTEKRRHYLHFLIGGKRGKKEKRATRGLGSSGLRPERGREEK